MLTADTCYYLLICLTARLFAYPFIWFICYICFPLYLPTHLPTYILIYLPTYLPGPTAVHLQLPLPMYRCTFTYIISHYEQTLFPPQTKHRRIMGSLRKIWSFNCEQTQRILPPFTRLRIPARFILTPGKGAEGNSSGLTDFMEGLTKKTRS